MLLQSAKSVPGYRTGQCIAKASVTSWHRPIGPGLKRTSSDVTASGSQHLFTSPRRTCSGTHAFREEKSAPKEGGTPAASAAAAHTAVQGSGTAGPAFSGRVEEELPLTVQTQALQASASVQACMCAHE